MNIVGYVVR